MSINTITNCDKCGACKGETNHWFRVIAIPHRLAITSWDIDPVSDHMHLCSDACVIKTAQNWLDAQKASMPADGR